MSTRKPTQADLDKFTKATIEQVYSGTPGCMCGCNGKYYKEGRMVTKILNILKADPDVMLQDEYILYIESAKQFHTRNYVAYLPKPND